MRCFKLLLFVVLFASLLIPAICFAQIPGYTGTLMGPDVSTYKGNKLKWEEGSHDYFVMFKTMLANNDPSNDGTAANPNPQGDTCLQSNSFKLDISHVPDDAYVEAAFLIWVGNGAPNNLAGPIKNNVNLNFTSDDGAVTVTTDVTASRSGLLGDQANNQMQDFEFEGMKFDRDGDSAFDTGYYTYRVGIDSFFAEIHQKGRENGNKYDGLSLMGTYTVSGVECHNDAIYTSGGAMIVGGWALVMIYKSEQVTPKKIYMYNGFKINANQEAPLKAQGFEFPDDPMVRITLMVNEGDPNMVDNTLPFSESLKFKGQQSTEWLYLANTCNPPMNYQGYNYTEIYNSISSFYGWQDTVPTCIGGVPPNIDKVAMQYAMDVDTFVFDSKDPLFTPHLKKGNTSLDMAVSANADVVFTNFLMLSVDTRAPRYDIPANTSTPSGREKNYCSCVNETDAICLDRPFYYTIKVQNWGDGSSSLVTVQDTLPGEVTYVAGSAEIATKFDENGNGTDWKLIEDKAGGAFPLSEPYLIAQSMAYCDNKTEGKCSDTVMIRFKVKPQSGLPKHTVIENTAIINDNSGMPYKTNTTVPLRLKSGNCPSLADCAEPDRKDCGGLGGSTKECEKNEDCGGGMICDNFSCKKDPGQFSSGAVLEFAFGKNSPSNPNGIIVVPAPSANLTVAQFSLIARQDGADGKFFSFDDLKVKFDISDSKIQLKSLKLVYDINGNGKKDENESVISSAESLGSSYGEFVVGKNFKTYAVNKLHYFVVVLDESYDDANVTGEATFQGKIENNSSVIASDSGKLSVKEGAIDFAKFRLESSSGFFIFTKGAKDPVVPAVKDMNKDIPVLQIRTKSADGSNSIESIAVKVASGGYVKFGEGIETMTLYLDTNNDGVGEDKISDSGTLEPGSSSYTFNTKDKLNFNAGEEKNLVINCKFKMAQDNKAMISVQKGGVKLSDSSKTILDLPVYSKEFLYKDNPEDITNTGQIGGGDGCGCTMVADGNSNTETILITIMLLSILMSFRLFFRKS